MVHMLHTSLTSADAELSMRVETSVACAQVVSVAWSSSQAAPGPWGGGRGPGLHVVVSPQQPLHLPSCMRFLCLPRMFRSS